MMQTTSPPTSPLGFTSLMGSCFAFLPVFHLYLDPTYCTLEQPFVSFSYIISTQHHYSRIRS
ncbi:hypothetical protein LY78DRAFT_659512, partial [Colletotrichum sublineola]